MIDFSTPGSSQRLNGLVNKDGTDSMLEASEFDSINNISPFLRELVDGLCGLTKSTETTSAFIEYVDTVNILFKRHRSFEWCSTQRSS